jgi:glycosyltransferase involved in cell wall biosynthesis
MREHRADHHSIHAMASASRGSAHIWPKRCVAKEVVILFRGSSGALMRVAHVVNSSSHGGAAIAARRLHEALLLSGVDSWMVTNEKECDLPARVLVPNGPQARVLLKATRGLELGARTIVRSSASQQRSLCVLGGSAPRILEALAPDITHLHWTTEGSLSIRQVTQLSKVTKLIWTLHDQWPITGLAHYPDLRRLSALESRIPARGAFRRFAPRDRLAAVVDSGLLRAKRRLWTSSEVSFIAPSEWMSLVAKANLSAAIDLSVIPNALPSRLRPSRSRDEARVQLNLDQGKLYVLYVAATEISHPLKGWQLVDLLHIDSTLSEAPVEIIVVGPTAPPKISSTGIPIRWLGSSQELAFIQDCYAAANAVVVPSLVDNAPQVVTEAIQARRRVVAFAVGGIPELLTHGKSGYLARPYSIDDLSAGVKWAIHSEDEQQLSAARGAVMDKWRGDAVARAHMSLYQRRLA